MAQHGYASAMSVARLLGITPSSVYRLGDRGKLRVARVGRAWYVNLDSLEAYLRGTDGRGFEPLLAEVQKLRERAAQEPAA